MKIRCPICDEELGNSIDEIPEKCPICDTRKHDILQEIKEKEKKSNDTEFIIELPSQEDDITEENKDEEEELNISTLVIEEEKEELDENTEKEEVSKDVILISEEKKSDINIILEDDKIELKDTSSLQVKCEPRKTGASTLEILPEGFKYCPTCGEVYFKNYNNRYCSKCEERSILINTDKGFPPGHYLILYNHKNKAITYFRLEPNISIFIGRAPEFSPKDINIATAWEYYYRKTLGNNIDKFKEKMSALKGISRKHALIKYLKEKDKEEKCIFIHLSDNNYSVVQFPTGEKKVRVPRNRNKIELKNGSIISLGNYKNYIVLRYKIFSL